MNSSLLPIIPAVDDILFNFAQSDDFYANLATAFGASYDVVKATQLRQQWQSRDFSQLPPITVKNLGNSGIFGAYSSSTNKIYISQTLIDSGDATTLKAVLLEEIGHFIDAQINSSDTPGDEGQLFSALVRGEALTGEQIAAIRGENDAATITVDGQAISVEMAFSGAINFTKAQALNLDTAQASDNYVDANVSEIAQSNTDGTFSIKSFTPNGDGKTDLIHFDVNNYVHLWQSNGDGTFSIKSFTPGGGYEVGVNNYRYETGDFNGDGKTDLIHFDVNNYVHLWQSNGDGKSIIFISDVTITEGNSGTTNAVFTVTLSNAVDTAVTLNYATADGTATTADNDYTALSLTPLTFNAGETSKTITVAVNGDTKVESNETFFVNLSSLNANGRNVTITDNQGQGTITNDDVTLPSITLAVSPSSVTEDGTSSLIYIFMRTGDTTNPLTVNYTVGGTATNGTDYTSIPTTVIFESNSAIATVIVDPTADTTVEPNETVALTLATGTGYTVGTPNTATGTINNDDTSVTLAVSPSSVTEDGTTNLVYTFTRSGVTTNALTVNYTVEGTATNGSDYTSIPTSVTFAANSETATVIVDPTADTTVENNETVALTLATGTGYTVGTTTPVTGTITNDDTSVTLAVSPTSVTEDGTTNLVYTFTRSGVTTNALTVNYTVEGTATNGSDYTSIPTSVTFAANSETATVIV
ncbi:MAG: calcium-binding protein, partial [Microcystis aeruginosa Ma_QC_Ch_20071001_S25]